MPRKYHLCEEKTFRLIAEVKKRPWIWNIEHEDYNDKHCLAKSWDEIGTTLGTPEVYLKAKWKTLRDTYRKELKKLSGDVYSGSWHYFQELRFLVFRDTNETEELPQKETEEQPKKETEDERDTSPEYEVQFESLGQNDMYWEQDPIQENGSNEEDFDVMFLKSLTPYLRQLGPMRRLVVRSKMQDMLLNELAAQNASRRRVNNGNI